MRRKDWRKRRHLHLSPAWLDGPPRPCTTTPSVLVQKSATEDGMVTELKNYIANMNTTGNTSLNITKATAFLRNQKRSYEAGPHPRGEPGVHLSSCGDPECEAGRSSVRSTRTSSPPTRICGPRSRGGLTRQHLDTEKRIWTRNWQMGKGAV